MKRYIIATRNNGYYGCDETEYYIFPEGTTDKEIDKYIEEGMYDYAEDYVNSVRGYDKDWENEDEEQEYYDNCCFDWRDASENEIEDYEEEWLSI